MEFSGDIVPFSKLKLKYFLDYYQTQAAKNFTFENLVKTNDDLNTIITRDPINDRLFITTNDRINMWNYYQDVILIDLTYKIHDNYYCAVVILSIYNFGHNYLLAFALTHEEKSEDYQWIFEIFREEGLKCPRTIIVDQNRAQLKAIKFFFGRHIHIVFCFWHIKRNIINSLPGKIDEWLNLQAEFYEVYNSRNDADFDCNWSLFIANHPELETNIVFSNLYENKECWARYSTRLMFTAGMSTTSRIEGMHANFKKSYEES
ncbi:unnamed protein product [Blepharisma stoltei]|uniref:MULE transposase domain-containing protein n=1 Tax=Blepharisma stoltei TaxID=1481888 RepID=A0AAU9JJ82_9CILI|nr:unnamed protein product [Blepharisma stoltei]